MFGALKGTAASAGVKNIKDVKAVVDRITGVLKWCFRIMYCCLILAGFAGLAFGVALGVFFLVAYPDDGGVFICAVGCIGGVIIFVYCGFQVYSLKGLWATIEVALDVASQASCTKEELIAKLKAKASSKITDKIGTAGAGYLGDMIMDEGKKQLRMNLFGPPALALLLGILLLGGSGQVDHDVAKAIDIAIGVLLIVGSCIFMCLAVPLYCAVVSQLESIVEELKERLAQNIKAAVSDHVEHAVDSAVGKVVK